MEVRTLARPIELRASDSGPGTATGYAYRFDSPSDDLGGFVERIAPGAGADALAAGDVVGLVDHDESRILGRKSAGTLRVAEDESGARYEIDLPDTSVGRDLATSLRRRDIVGSSFAFRVAVDGEQWGEDADGRILRTITRMSYVRDVSPVTFPAYPATDAALRSLSAARKLDPADVLAAAKEGRLGEVLHRRRTYRHASSFIY